MESNRKRVSNFLDKKDWSRPNPTAVHRTDSRYGSPSSTETDRKGRGKIHWRLTHCAENESATKLCDFARKIPNTSVSFIINKKESISGCLYCLKLPRYRSTKVPTTLWKWSVQFRHRINSAADSETTYLSVGNRKRSATDGRQFVGGTTISGW